MLNARVSRSLAALYSDRFGLTPPEWRAVAALAQYEPLSASGICARTDMDKVQVTRAIARLIQSQLVSRDSDDSDRRFLRLTLTPKGRDIYDQILPLVRAKEAEILSALGPDEQKSLDALLIKLGV